MNNLKDKFRRFMVGRYGTDELNGFLLTIILVMVVCNLFIRSSFLVWIELLCLILSYLRMFSKKYGKAFSGEPEISYVPIPCAGRLKKYKAPR